MVQHTWSCGRDPYFANETAADIAAPVFKLAVRLSQRIMGFSYPISPDGHDRVKLIA
jgi:hypothetical protein